VSKNASLSENDARLLQILQKDGRRSYADLGTDLGMAGPSVHERVKKLESRGVIRGYSADVNPVAVGLGVLAFTWVTQAPGTVATDLMPDFAAIGEIEECHHIAGEADYLLKIRARDMEHLGTVVRNVQTTANVFATETDVVFTTGFERRPLPMVRDDRDQGETGRVGGA
jgi:Lrp/AsnC family transcriptional regulator, leucine-responsive regulatory protein